MNGVVKHKESNGIHAYKCGGDSEIEIVEVDIKHVIWLQWRRRIFRVLQRVSIGGGQRRFALGILEASTIAIVGCISCNRLLCELAILIIVIPCKNLILYPLPKVIVAPKRYRA